MGKYEAYFNGFVLFCICVAGILVGLQTYEEVRERDANNTQQR